MFWFLREQRLAATFGREGGPMEHGAVLGPPTNAVVAFSASNGHAAAVTRSGTLFT